MSQGERPDPAKDDPAVETALATVSDLITARGRLAEAEATRDAAQKRVDEIKEEVDRAEEAAREVLGLPWGEDR